MDDIGENGEFIAFFHIVAAPIVGQLIARFLPRHALLNPFVAASMGRPGFAGAVKRQGRI